MSVGQYGLVVYAILMAAGGVFGARAGSRVSLYAGLGSAAALLGALGLTYWELRIGLVAGAVLAVLLAVTFARRFFATGKFMPSGMLFTVSAIAAALLGYAAWVAGS